MFAKFLIFHLMKIKNIFIFQITWTLKIRKLSIFVNTIYHKIPGTIWKMYFEFLIFCSETKIYSKIWEYFYSAWRNRVVTSLMLALKLIKQRYPVLLFHIITLFLSKDTPYIPHDVWQTQELNICQKLLNIFNNK